MQKKEFYRGTEERTPVYEMKKADLMSDLEMMRDDYDKLMLKQELHRMIDRIESVSKLQEVRDYTEKAYMDFANSWRSVFGCRDDIVFMADYLAERLDSDGLVYLSHFMYGKVLDDGDNKDREFLRSLPYVSDMMKKWHYETPQAKLENRNC